MQHCISAAALGQVQVQTLKGREAPSWGQGPRHVAEGFDMLQPTHSTPSLTTALNSTATATKTCNTKAAIAIAMWVRRRCW